MRSVENLAGTRAELTAELKDNRSARLRVDWLAWSMAETRDYSTVTSSVGQKEQTTAVPTDELRAHSLADSWVDLSVPSMGRTTAGLTASHWAELMAPLKAANSAVKMVWRKVGSTAELRARSRADWSDDVKAAKSAGRLTDTSEQ